MYSNADTEKVNIFKDNKNKCGVYRWINLETNKSYVGSSVNLRRRFNTYYSFSYLTRNKSLISKALLKYGYSRFRLEILEYCDPSVLMEREQYYIDLLKPEYNILKIAGSLLGFKHSDSTRERLSKFYTGRIISPEVRDKLSNSQKGRVHTAEALVKMSKSKLGRKLSEEHKKNISAACAGRAQSQESKLKITATNGTAVVVHDTETGENTNFLSIREVSRHFSVSNNTISKYIKLGLLFKNKFKISKLS